jgi:N-acetylmuramoyl-L-alanine amidase
MRPVVSETCRTCRVLVALLLVLCCQVACALSARGETYQVQLVPAGRRETIEVTRIEGTAYFLLSDVARAAVASRHWNPVTGKMTLAVGSHTLAVSADNQFVSLDGSVRNLRHPVLLVEGDLWVPEQLLHGPLSEALNSDISIDHALFELVIYKLGARVLDMSIEQRPEGSALQIALNDRAPFAVRSRNRGRIDLFLPAATLADSLSAVESDGLIHSVDTAQSEDGVRVTVRVAPSATSYEAEMRSDPFRLEVVVSSEREESIPPPLLRGSRQLVGDSDPFGALETGIETVMIDPGHGGTQTGRIGPSGLAEKDATLALAEMTAEYLQREGFYVFMTRSSDSEVPLKRRSEIANLSGADIFVSIHCGSWYSGAAGGFRVSYYEPAGERRYQTGGSESGGLVRVSAGAGPGPAGSLVWGSSQEAVLEESGSLARAIHASLARSVDIRDRGVGGLDLAVLAGCTMPAALIEPAYISNPYEAAMLEDDAFLRRAASAIATGIADHRKAMRRRGN